MAKSHNRTYTVYDDLSSEKSSDNYPTLPLCDDCVGNYEVVVEGGPSSNPCDECGGPEDGDEYSSG